MISAAYFSGPGAIVGGILIVVGSIFFGAFVSTAYEDYLRRSRRRSVGVAPPAQDASWLVPGLLLLALVVVAIMMG